MTPQRKNRRRPGRPPQRGAALLMCLFVIFVVSTLVLNVLDTEMLQLAATRNTIEYEKALYQANAGVHHACSELINNSTWRGTLQDGTLPPSTPADGYSVTAVDDGSGGVTVTSTGYAGLGQRTVEANVEI